MTKTLSRPYLAAALLTAPLVVSANATDDLAAHSLPVLTVTASKLGTTEFDTPTGVTVTEGDAVEDYRYSTLGDLAERQSNLYLTSFTGHTPQLVFRGLGFSDDESDSVSSSVLIDGVPVFGLALGQLFDLDQVELLRGPQSTLYGQNSMAGVMAVATRAPQPETAGALKFEYGTGNRRRGELTTNLALSERTAARLALGGEWADGYTDNQALDRNDTADWASGFGRLRLSHLDEAGGQWHFGLHLMDHDGGNDYFAGQDQADDHHSVAGDPGQNDVRFALVTGEYRRPLEAGGEWVTTLGSSSYDWRYWVPASLFDARSGYHMEGHQSSLETRLNGLHGELDWLLGGFVSHSEREAPYTFDMGPAYTSKTHSEVTGQTAALFGEGGWSIGNGWRAAAALRLEFNHREMDWQALNRGLMDADGDGTPETPFEQIRQLEDIKATDRVLLPRFTLAHRDGHSSYRWLTLARGYKASGFNLFTGSEAIASTEFDAEFGNYVELGQRLQDPDGAWQLSGNLFYMKLTDQQVVVVNDQNATMTTNAGRSHSAGLELEGSVWPTDMVRVQVRGALLEAEYDRYRNQDEDLAGDRFPNAPRYSYGLALSWQPASGWRLGASATRQGSTSVYGNTAIKSPGYTQVDAMAGYYRPDWQVSVFGKNLLDEDYYVRAMNNGMVVPGAPRTLGLRLGLSF